MSTTKGLTLRLSAIALALSFSPTFAAKPFQVVGGAFVWNGNNYPSGAHYNLNIHGKKDGFECPPAEYQWEITAGPDGGAFSVGSVYVGPACPDSYTCVQGDQVFGNVINVSRNPADANGILWESGGKGPKSSPEVQTLEVVDWCTKPFDGSDAQLRIPKDSEGYMVFARLTGKPGNGDTQVAIDGCLQSVSDETGNDMMMLGLVTTDGQSYVPNCATGTSDPVTLVRYDGPNGKGASKATDITRLFEWSGTTYQFLDAETCSAEAEGCINLCCPDGNGDGVFNGECLPREADPITGQLPACAVGYTPVAAQGTVYENAWVFNIGDFVEYLWNLENDGTYNIKVRLYPLSQQEWWPLPELN